MLSFAQRNFEAAVPRPGNLNAEDQQILRATATAFEEVGTAIEACRFRNAVGSAMALAREANRYLDAAAPWKHLKTDRERAATTTYVTLRVIDSLKILFTPFLPFSSQALHEALGYQGSIMGSQQVDHVQESTRDHTVLTYQHELSGDLWQPSDLPPGQPLGHVKPLFVKLDESIVEEEIERLHQHSRPS
jgi:methionyl-tRNA synthetase